MLYADVILNETTQNLDRRFLYAIPDGIRAAVGDLVLVPLGPKRRVHGFILALHAELTPDMAGGATRIKPIEKILSPALFDERGIALMEFMRREYLCGHLEALRLLIPRGELKGTGHKYRSILVPGEAIPSQHRSREAWQPIIDYVRSALADGGVIKAEATRAGFSASSINTLIRHGFLTVEERIADRYSTVTYQEDAAKVLNDEQAQAFDRITRGGPGTYLLHGITGSGKTEVFLHLVSHMLAKDHDSVVLVPEIALTPQMIERVKARFGAAITVYHSRLSDGERYDEWMRVRQGKVRIAIGARSALFLPFRDLRLVVVDEEHESSYKSETNPKYVTRDVADFMMALRGGKVVLASATPSMEAYDRAIHGQYQLVTLTRRAGAGAMPRVITVDMRKELRLGNRSILSGLLEREMTLSLARGRQIILFLNRRGVSGFVSCRACGFVYKCPNCSVSLTKHQGGRLTCHHCGHSQYQQANCPQCGSPYIREFGIGTEKVETEVKRRFPDARILRMDRDTTSHKEAYEDIYRTFRSGGADILIGTQMVAKGLDFHGVDLVGILAADLSMNLPDFRAYEKTFQLITQVSGRAGRGDEGGQVILQTYQPESYPVVLAARADYLEFFQQEMRVRDALKYPPRGQLLSLVLSGQDETELINCIQKVALVLRESFGACATITIMGPSPCLLSRIKGWYRQQIILKGAITPEAARMTRDLAYDAARGKEIRVSIDANPVTLV